MKTNTEIAQRFKRRLLAMAMTSTMLAALSTNVAVADEMPEMEIRIANSYQPQMSSGIAIDHFAKRVAELSDGKITAKVYHSGTLYSEDKSIQAVLDGTIHMGLASLSNHAPFTSAWRELELPYLFQNRKQFREIIINGEIGDELRKASESDGLVPLMILEQGGFRTLATNSDIRTPSDLNNVKIRVPQSAIPLDFWRAAGANPTVIAWSETYLALASDTVNGVDASFPAIPLGKLWEVTKYVTDIKYSSVASVVDASTTWWNGLSDAQRDIILQAAKEAEILSMEVDDAEEASIRQSCVDNGMTINELTDEEFAQWVEIGKATWEQVPDLSAELLTRIQEAVAAVE